MGVVGGVGGVVVVVVVLVCGGILSCLTRFFKRACLKSL